MAITRESEEGAGVSPFGPARHCAPGVLSPVRAAAEVRL